MKQTLLLTTSLSFVIIITSQTYGMENSPQCTLVHAPNNPNLVVLCEPKALYIYNPTTSSCTTKEKDHDTYLSIAANNDLITIQRKKGLELHSQNPKQKIRKSWHPNLGTTCHSQIALFPDDNDTFVVHNVDENETTITHSIEIHSINLQHKITSFCERFNKSGATGNIDLKPLIACHPHKKQVAFKLDDSTLALHNLLPESYAEMTYLLHGNEDPKETSFALFPKEIRELIGKNLVLSLGIKYITKRINFAQELSYLFIPSKQHFIEYSPDGSLIVIFCNNNHYLTYQTLTEKCSESSYLRSSDPYNDPQACTAFYPFLSPISITLFNSGIMYCSAANHRMPPIELNCNESIPSGVTKKIMAFSGDGKILYIAKGNELIKYTISDEKVAELKKLSL